MKKTDVMDFDVSRLIESEALQSIYFVDNRQCFYEFDKFLKKRFFIFAQTDYILDMVNIKNEYFVQLTNKELITCPISSFERQQSALTQSQLKKVKLDSSHRTVYCLDGAGVLTLYDVHSM